MKNKDFVVKREFASYNFECPYKCNHCYTFSNGFKFSQFSKLEDIISSLEYKDFNTIYISGYTENFFIPSKGIDLIERIYNRFKCNMLFTTRNVFSEYDILRLSKINKKMKKNKNLLIACVSISAWESYEKLEPNPLIPTPQKRSDFLKELHNNGIISILTIRPVCPSEYIPTNEYLEILKRTYSYCDAVISSGIVVNADIRKRLVDFPSSVAATTKPIMDCLQQQNLIVDYVDTSKELNKIFNLCDELNIVHFSSSIPAIEYIYTLYTY